MDQRFDGIRIILDARIAWGDRQDRVLFERLSFSGVFVDSIFGGDQRHVEGTADLRKVKLPFTVADHLTKLEAEGVVAQIQEVEGEASMRISKSQLGDILGAFFFSYALFQVPAGWFSDRLGARKMLAIYISSW